MGWGQESACNAGRDLIRPRDAGGDDSIHFRTEGVADYPDATTTEHVKGGYGGSKRGNRSAGFLPQPDRCSTIRRCRSSNNLPRSSRLTGPVGGSKPTPAEGLTSRAQPFAARPRRARPGSARRDLTAPLEPDHPATPPALRRVFPGNWCTLRCDSRHTMAFSFRWPLARI